MYSISRVLCLDFFKFSGQLWGKKLFKKADDKLGGKISFMKHYFVGVFFWLKPDDSSKQIWSKYNVVEIRVVKKYIPNKFMLIRKSCKAFSLKNIY